MRYHITASGQAGVMALKRDTVEGALKKAGELRQEGLYSEVRIFDSETGSVIDEHPSESVQEKGV